MHTEKKEEAGHVREGKVNEEEDNEQEVKDVLSDDVGGGKSKSEKETDDKFEMMFAPFSFFGSTAS